MSALSLSPVPTASDLRQRFTAAGFVEGAPPSLTTADLDVDRRTVHGMRCPCCRRRQMRYEPFHNPTTRRYKVLASCTRCPGAEEA